MKSDERRQAIKRQREQLIQDLEAVYLAAFDRLGELEGEVGEVKAAQLTQMILNSKTAAIEPPGERDRKTGDHHPRRGMSSWLEQLERELDARLSAFLRNNPVQDHLFSEQHLKDRAAALQRQRQQLQSEAKQQRQQLLEAGRGRTGLAQPG